MNQQMKVSESMIKAAEKAAVEMVRQNQVRIQIFPNINGVFVTNAPEKGDVTLHDLGDDIKIVQVKPKND